MIYSPANAALHCFCCRLLPYVTSSWNSKGGFSKWWKLSDKLKEHEGSASHSRSFMEWRDLELRLGQNKTIDSIAQREFDKEVSRWKLLLVRIFDITK